MRMPDGKINARILKGIRENSEGDELIANFLIDLIYEEVEGPPFRWKEFMKREVEQYLKAYGDIYENKED